MKKRYLITAIALSSCLLLTACGSSSVTNHETAANNTETFAEVDSKAVSAGDNAISKNSMSTGMSENSTSQTETDQKIIRSADISINTENYDKTKEQVGDLVIKYKGAEVSNSETLSNYDGNSSSNSQNARTGYLNYKIPSKYLSAFVSGISKVEGTVTHSSTSSDDVRRTGKPVYRGRKRNHTDKEHPQLRRQTGKIYFKGQ